MQSAELIMLGTGNAMVTHCYNTCFLLRLAGGDYFLTDAGGGNGILGRLEEARIDYDKFHYMFVTHGHTDHVIGVLWVIRKIASLMAAGKYNGDFHIYCHDVVKHILLTMAGLMLKKKDAAFLGQRIYLHEIHHGETVSFLGLKLTAFDIFSTKAKQFGYRLRLPDGTVFVCLGDEPYNERDKEYAQQADWLLSEAFCLYEDRDIFHPYEKHHSTVKEAAETASQLDARHLLLYHTEETHLPERKQLYTAEAGHYYTGPVYVPDDMEHITL
ncbi:MAG: MBL fold metallo-hydrolase [Megasphaera sp.]|jgi:ribonuclease Z|nr:MBL fold metallo-hydrolase [Megasphaera sp.]MCI1248363.1 MBL fold metallo-hydrolase [Megasphaera sp.]